MTISIAIGLALQGMAVTIVHVTVRGRWLSHAGAIFLAMSVVFHGLTEVIQLILPGYNNYRRLINQHDLDRWMILVSTAILIYAGTYAIVMRYLGRGEPITPADLTGIKTWWLLALTVPVLVSMMAGRSETKLESGGAEYFVGGLTTQFLMILVSLAGAQLILRWGSRWLLPVLGGQVLLISLSGQRNLIIMTCVVTVFVAALCGVRPSRPQLLTACACGLVVVFGISAARSTAGRESFDPGQGSATRLTAVATGVQALGTAEGWDSVRQDTVYRFDGNILGTLVDARLAAGAAPIGLATVRNSLDAAVPSFVDPRKTDRPVDELSEKAYIVDHLGLYYFYQMDFLPGWFGPLAAYGGPWILLILAALLGLLTSGIDILVRRRPSGPKVILAAGFVLSFVQYERGLPNLVLVLRGALVIAVIAWLVARHESRGMWNFHDASQFASGSPASSRRRARVGGTVVGIGRGDAPADNSGRPL
jgi:hypothetical protein